MTVLTVHCITALERVRDNLAIPDPVRGSTPLPSHRQFICLGLEWEARKDFSLFAASQYLTKFIEARLSKQGCLESWLVAHVPEADQLCSSDRAAFDLRTYHTRLAWIDSLIQELMDQP